MIPVTVVIPYHPAREESGMLDRAVRSVENQIVIPEVIMTVEDTGSFGATATRQLGLDQVETEWVTFLDSDDEMKPEHLGKLYDAALYQGADMVYSWYDVIGGADPRRKEFGLPWDPDNPRQTTIVTLSRTKLAQQVGFQEIEGENGTGEDWYFTQGMNSIGARIYHLPERTWKWYHHGRNTSGRPYQGDAKRSR